MIVIGTLIRGPGWMWFWPGTTWDHNRLEFAVNRDLPDIFGIKGRRDEDDFRRNRGRDFTSVVSAIGIHKLMNWTPFARKIFKRMSLLQIVTMQVFLIIMLSLPIKILARLLFRIKYVWVTPWFNV